MAANDFIRLQGEENDKFYQERLSWTKTLKDFRDQKKGTKFPEGATSTTSALADSKELAGLDGSVETPLIILDHRHRPCATELEDLQKVTISDLEVEIRYPGTVLIVRKLGPATQTWSRLLVGVQDETGQSCLLTFNQHMRDVPAEEFIPDGAVLAIKEPYAHIDFVHPPNTPEDTKIALFCVIRVDHPTDLIVLSTSDDLIPSQWCTDTIAETAMSWKAKGNLAFAESHFLQAHRCYTEGIKLSTKNQCAQGLAADLYRNRARTGLSLSCYDDAKSDALKSFSLLPSVDGRTTELNIKALTRAATAAYRLGRFEESKALLVRLDSLNQDDRNAKLLATKVEQRLSEQAEGRYDFKKIRERVQSRGTIDAASFTCMTEVQKMPHGGTGLFATRDIEAGGLVLCEKAFVIVAPENAEDKPAHLVNIVNKNIVGFSEYDAALWKNAIDKISRNRSTATQLDTLDSFAYTRICKMEPRTTKGSYDDVFFLSEIVHGNSVPTPPKGPDMDRRPGLWVRYSHMSHSCMPNTAAAYIGDLVIVRATREIRAGEQLYAQRSILQPDYNKMKETLDIRSRGATLCDCAICIAEELTTPAQRAARQDVLTAMGDFATSVQGLCKLTTRGHADLLMNQGKELEKALSSTYDDETFTGVMPRRGFTHLYAHMDAVRMHQLNYLDVETQQDLQKSLEILLKTLKAQGCEVAVDSAGNVSFETLYHTDLGWTERLLIQCSRVATMTGHANTSIQFSDLAKSTHLLHHCDLAEF